MEHLEKPANPIGIFANTFKSSSFEGVLDAVKAHGLATTELNLSSLDVASLAGTDTLPLAASLSEGLIQKVQSACRERGITVVSLAAYFNMIHPDKKQRNAGLRQLEPLMKLAKALDIKILALCTGTRDPEQMWRYHPANHEPQAYRDLLDSLNEALALAETYDRVLAFEPEVNLVINSPRKARDLLAELASPRLKVIFDPANIFPEGGLNHMHQLMTEAAHLLAEDMVLAHAKDILEDGQAGDVAAGKGKLDYGHYLKLLREIGFGGAILLHGLSEAEVAGSLRHLKNSMG